MTERATPDCGDSIRVALGQFGVVIACGLRQVLTEDRGVEVVDDEIDHIELEQAIARRAPQVVVLSEASVAERSVCGWLGAVGSGVGVVVIAHWPTKAFGARMLASGVAVCLSVDASASDVGAAVRLAAAGRQALVPPHDSSILIAHLNGIAALTPREREVLSLLSRGEANAMIALKLAISTETARTHVKNILRKLRVQTRRELVGVAIPEYF